MIYINWRDGILYGRVGCTFFLDDLHRQGAEIDGLIGWMYLSFLDDLHHPFL